MAETIYPERQRCKTCRKKLEDNVFVGMYCSYRCGKLPNPAKNITEAPRGCKREVNGQWGYKTRYKSPKMVPEKYQIDPSTNIYLCDNCQTYHIGHSRVEVDTSSTERLLRYVKDNKELGSVIQRFRESRNIDKKTIAKALKIPAIRITEIESGSPSASVVNLMNVLNYLKLKIEISSPPRR